MSTGAPVSTDALGAFDCVLERTIEYAATTIAIGRVVDLRLRGGGDPLIFFRGAI